MTTRADRRRPAARALLPAEAGTRAGGAPT
ncbi:hypothetical protein J2Z21_003693 [Streptomyces griseochromogenes]|uniref:Uncharacterized protein n=1 Tax=Streptomyces griseochromogenes TaxID=68214 RepID=A0ABS4LTR6_9ACTN|nr:hypothetical protein [Streptomyces griseochromogenes]